jgi:hypothetical protein
VPFDLQRLETTGTPSRVIEHIADNAGSAGAQFSVSSSGALVYLAGGQSTNSAPLVWLDATGKTQPMRAPGLYLAPRLLARRPSPRAAGLRAGRIEDLDLRLAARCDVASDGRNGRRAGAVVVTGRAAHRLFVGP